MASRASLLRKELEARRQAQLLLSERNRLLWSEYRQAHTPFHGMGLVAGGALLGATCYSLVQGGYPQAVVETATRRWLYHQIYHLMSLAWRSLLSGAGWNGQTTPTGRPQ